MNGTPPSVLSRVVTMLTAAHRQEPLYEKIKGNVITSELLSDPNVDVQHELHGSRVILCTLSMLAHPVLIRSGITRLVPIETVLVDEASQIEIHDYIPILNKFHYSIRKLAFVGDDFVVVVLLIIVEIYHAMNIEYADCRAVNETHL